MTKGVHVEHKKYRLDELSHYHKNARRGDVKAIAESLKTNGQYKPIVVNKGGQTGRENEVLVGNHTMQAARVLGWATIDAVVVDVNDAEARRIVLADNRTSDLGSYDNELLEHLLSEMDDLTGTGFTDVDLDELTTALADPTDDDWADGFAKIPEGEQEFFTVSFSLTAPQHAALMTALENAEATVGDIVGNRNASLLIHALSAGAS